ncbi:MAG: galactokinase [Bacteroidetes bacterium]|jgi:galactokinase|nr:galactokinase [Bacteroidota bacterium]MBL0080470.1 galactokinase [Bacteroidota bacterium]MBL0286930.1 galactokinase [Bacteroidota bacterium]
MLSKESANEIFLNQFSYTAEEYCFSPGRINLIGEHIDYNGGLVLPFAINKGILAAFKKNENKIIRIYSADFEDSLVIDLGKAIEFPVEVNWKTYILGMIEMMNSKGFYISGMDIIICSDLPLGSGLSSSAALECLIGYVFANEYYDKNRKELALDAQHVEHEYAKVKCGIMDQFAVANGKKEMGMLLDCNNLQSNYLPIELKNFTLLVINSNKPRALVDSKYNERRVECDKILALLDGFDPSKELANLNPLSLAYIEDDILYSRAKHILTENNRVKMASNALADGNIEALGQLLLASHQSLDEDYEVAGHELNTIVKYAMKVKECVGARMTGAGFGGCCIAIVEKNAIAKFKQYVSKKYQENTHYTCAIFEVEISDGVGFL